MRPFANSLEHVLAELERVDLLIRVRVARARQSRQGDDRFLGLYISEEQVDELMAGPAALQWEKAPAQWHQVERAVEEAARAIAARKAASASRGIRLRLAELERLFGVSALDVDVILVCLAPALDLRYERLFAYLQDDVTKRRPSVDLVLNLLSGSFSAKVDAHARFARGAPLIHHRLVELFDDPVQPHPPLIGRYLQLDERIARFLLGSDEVDASLATSARCVALAGDMLEAPPAALAALERAVAQASAGRRLVVHVQGARGVGKLAWAEALAGRLGLGLLIVDVDALPVESRAAFASAARGAAREAALQGAALYLRGFDAVLGDERRPHRTELLQVLTTRPGLSLLAGSRPWAPSVDGTVEVVHIELPRPTRAERELLWTRHLGGTLTPDLEREIPELASKFRFTGGEIHAAATLARARARWRRPEEPSLTREELYASCRARSQTKLGELARKIPPHHDGNDLVLGVDGLRQLQEIRNRVRHRARVLEDWGFERKLALGRGLNALFSGPSGTGKTMAAGILARELGLDLYKLDLSTVVSKYIGETEKNLARVFAEAEDTNAILFFDEADALFGKRSDVKDAHDRYANIETSYLLQRMEEYDGISILATNLRRNMDDAFVRRIAFVVHFPLPDELDRLRIWRGVFPEATPRAEDVDLAFMAKQFKLSGGSIKNIALAAAFLAADDDRPVTMGHLVRATHSELQKMGRSPAPAEFGVYGQLFA